MKNRTDIHSPGNFDPSAYTYIGTVYFGMSDEVADVLNEVHLDDYVGRFFRAGWGEGDYLGCDHCGARFAYGAVYEHKDGDVIVVGHICAGVAFGCDSRREYDLKKAKRVVKLVHEKAKCAKAAAAFMVENPGLEEAFSDEKIERHHILKDMAGKLLRWGSLSDKQVAFALRLSTELDTPKAPPVCDHCHVEGHKLDDCGERAKVTDGRREITGQVLTVKSQDSMYGSILKMLVLTDEGSKLWGTVPSALTYFESRCQRGDRVVFTAKVSPSNDDPFFGFYSRPTKANLLVTADNLTVRRAY